MNGFTLLIGLAALLSGLSILLNRVFNARLAEHIGVFQSTLINYITGISLSLVLFIVLGNGSQIPAGGGLPFWAYLGGALGVVVIALNNFISSKISNFSFTLLNFVGQVSCGFIIDRFQGIELSTVKLIGCLLIVTGLAIHMFLNRRPEQKLPSSIQTTTPDSTGN